MRFDCEIEGFEGCFVEYSDAWSMRQYNTFLKEKGAPFIALLQAKTVAVHFTTLEDFVIDDPAQLEVETVQALDVRLFEWWIGTAQRCVEELTRLGEALRRSSSATRAVSPE